MIKLIASDMDGTLLDDDSKVPEETYELISALAEKGERQAGRGREAQRQASRGQACGMRRRRPDKGEGVLLASARSLDGCDRALLEPLGGANPREGVADPHLGVGHDSTSLSLRLPREIHE